MYYLTIAGNTAEAALSTVSRDGETDIVLSHILN